MHQFPAIPGSPLLLICFALLIACNETQQVEDGVTQSKTTRKDSTQNHEQELEKNPAFQLDQIVVRRIFQDQRGHLWFGTNGNGVFRFDGESSDDGRQGICEHI